MTCGCHTVSSEDFERLLASIAQGNEADAERMPDERAALRTMFSAYQRLKALGFRDIAYCPKDGRTRQFVEAGCTSIGDGHCDAEGRVWLYEAGDLWPSHPILFREHPSSTASTADPDREGRERTS